MTDNIVPFPQAAACAKCKCLIDTTSDRLPLSHVTSEGELCQLCFMAHPSMQAYVALMRNG